MTNHKILLVDDDHDVLEMLLSIFQRAGYTNLRTAVSGAEALRTWQEEHPSLIVLDVMMPGMDGFSVLKEIRRTSRVPVLMLTARGEADDRIEGLEIGADDYLAKPFGVRELIARVRALLRRGQGGEFPGASNSITASGITLDEDAHTAAGDHGEIDLTPREFELLASLMKNAGKVVSREDLLRDAWGWEYLTETKTVDTHIKRLRDKIHAAGYDPALVETVRGYGYRFKA